ncbi:phosphopantetheine binding protein [Saccharopolyspora erythraea NRRL 2338]|uniref:Peptide carrier protein n=2 Tax=Saccharopolyspora erythraea TaxID=1836 RepID=A4FHP9_SACEN|nr:acyl carrier protein [Saccharopolyspora erythraea]EQD86823.1 polyketide synthase [Saccharopolyspora erythraea D]PFG97262.1 phosphopantetheine binding protein [Saccharopolyspora erythraea NRRL 2338]QRK87457.1 acyl carrier protein [Saccharopolyspora erythraea]CAM03574.1 peptide carrier protein [Saccharopolyspora erythraea NRRL 2338]
MANDAIRTWLTERIACYLQLAATDIDPAVPLAEHGLDSVSALLLCGDIEDTWGVATEPTLAYEHPTIDDIARFVDAERGQRRAA